MGVTSLSALTVTQAELHAGRTDPPWAQPWSGQPRAGGAVVLWCRCFRYGFAPLVAPQVISSYDGEAGQLVLEEHMQVARQPILPRCPHPPARYRITPDSTTAAYPRHYAVCLLRSASTSSTPLAPLLPPAGYRMTPDCTATSYPHQTLTMTPFLPHPSPEPSYPSYP